MAPVKFGLFKSRSREQPEQPSTENLLQSQSFESVQTPSSPVASTSKAIENLAPDITSLQLESDDDDEGNVIAMRRLSEGSRLEDTHLNYQPLRNASVDATSMSTLQDYEPERDDTSLRYEFEDDGASTSCDALSLQMDASSLAASEDISLYCGTLKRPKKSRSKEERQQLRDSDMWQASDLEVMQNLLSRSGTLDEQIKWEAIATARGLCTLTDNCGCGDCSRAKYLAAVTDGDGGLGSAPLFSYVGVGCSIQ